jgi:lauroyl/myristoyl acyltransferase
MLKRGLRLPARRGGVGQAREPLATAADLAVLAKLPASALAAWCLPERRWEAVAARAAVLERRTVERTAGRIAAMFGPDAPASPKELARRQLALVRLDQLCFLRSYRPGGWRAEMRLSGRHHLDDALLAGRGAVLWLAPTVFQWLPAKRTLFEAGYRVHHLSSPQHGFSGRSWLSRAWLNPIRTRVEDRYLAERVMLGSDGQAHSALRRLGNLLAENATVSITMAPARTRSIRTPLLRGFLNVAAGPPHLAVRSGAALLPVVTLRTASGRFQTHIGAALGAVGGPAGQAMAAELTAWLEPYLLAHPEQVVWGLPCFEPP